MARLVRTPIGIKLFLAVLASMVPVIALMMGLSYLSLGRGFLRYVHEVEFARLEPLAGRIEHFYGHAGDWSFVPRDPPAFHHWLRMGMEQSRPGGGRHGGRPPPPPGYPPPYFDFGGPPPPFGHGPGFGHPPLPGADEPLSPDRLGQIQRIALLDAQGNRLAGPPEAASNGDRRALKVDGVVVGYLAFAQARVLASDLDQRFLADQTRHFLLICILAAGLSAIAAWLAARHLRRPIGELLAATRALAGGAFDTRLETRRGDELGDLARSFNELGEALAGLERTRRQWVADTSHELRTPIAVLRAQIEAMQDGVHPTDSRSLAVLHGEVMGLTTLVNDLYTLARADVGRLEVQAVPVEPLAVLDEVAARFAARYAGAGLSLEAPDPADGPPWITAGDPGRLRQLFANLLENALRYSDPGGKVVIGCRRETDSLTLLFDDTPPGIPEAELPRLFERFYRVESSRSRESGGSGLGLAICRGIVEAHGGRIRATASPLGGLRVEIVLPYRDPRQFSWPSPSPASLSSRTSALSPKS